MINRKYGIIVCLLCFCFCLMPFRVMATSTSEAEEPIIPENECSLTVSYCYEQTPFSDIQVKLYRVADVSADFKFTFTQNFESSGLSLDDIRTSGEWNIVRSTLEAHILANQIVPEFTSTTNANGQAVFEFLRTGMYLAVANKDDMQYRFDSALISLPGLGQDGRWQYQVSVNAKGEALPPVEPDEKIDFKVLKLWRGDEGGTGRPQSVEVEIFCDGVSHNTVILSRENLWTYSWSAPDDGAKWTVVERNIPQGYKVTVEERESTFILTNTWTVPQDPGNTPQTGDTSNVMLYVLLLVGSGILLIILGILGKKSRV